MLSICLLASGGLGFQMLKFLCQSTYNVTSVFTDRNSKQIIEYCNGKGIPLFPNNPRNGKAKDFFRNISCDILLSINYLYIIESDLIGIPKKYAINIHGSLLPKYRGRTPHVWAIINGEFETGITAHLIDKDVDAGDIIRQLKVPIHRDDTGASILNKFGKLYPKFIEMVLSDVLSDNLSFTKQDNTIATYFGKRTPKDGRINWNWCKERIRNWIRAQAKPYPGAFTFYNNNKIIVHRAEFNNHGFQQSNKNGTILFTEPNGLIIKTPNGALRISNIESHKFLDFKKGKVLA